MWTTSGREGRDTFLPGEEAPHGEGRIDGEGGSGDSAAHPPAVLGRREDSDRAGGAPRGREHRGALPPRRPAPNLYYRWSKEFLEAGKKRLLGDTTREATSTEVQDLRRDNSQLKQVVAEAVLENRVLKNNLVVSGAGDDTCD